jgi:hypothetical protein
MWAAIDLETDAEGTPEQNTVSILVANKLFATRLPQSSW